MYLLVALEVQVDELIDIRRGICCGTHRQVDATAVDAVVYVVVANGVEE
jgi:hypothetical protein